jgi:hypothetical protein
MPLKNRLDYISFHKRQGTAGSGLSDCRQPQTFPLGRSKAVGNAPLSTPEKIPERIENSRRATERPWGRKSMCSLNRGKPSFPWKSNPFKSRPQLATLNSIIRLCSMMALSLPFPRSSLPCSPLEFSLTRQLILMNDPAAEQRGIYKGIETPTRLGGISALLRQAAGN